MAKHADISELMPACEKAFTISSLHEGLRTDGRHLMEMRNIRICFGRDHAESRAEVQIGQTRVLAVATSELVTPQSGKPTEGFLSINVEMSPMASPAFDSSGRPGPEATTIRSLLERALKDGNAIDLEALCVVAGERVWSIRIDIHILDAMGNIVDTCALAVIAALMHFRKPFVTVENGIATVHSYLERMPVPLSIHHLPICITFAAFANNHNQVIIVDPSAREELLMDGCVTFSLNSHRELCAVRKAGGCALTIEQLLRCAHVAAEKALHVTKQLRSALEDGERRASERRLAFRPQSMTKMPTSHLLSAIQNQFPELNAKTTPSTTAQSNDDSHLKKDDVLIMAKPKIGAEELKSRWTEIDSEVNSQKKQIDESIHANSTIYDNTMTNNEENPENHVVESIRKHPNENSTDKSVKFLPNENSVSISSTSLTGPEQTSSKTSSNTQKLMDSDSDASVDLLQAVKKKKGKRKRSRRHKG
eukprot:GSMAST32.ASY1.ANO1.1334.1 assembled CDS